MPKKTNTIKHPHYPSGEPILLGDRFKYTATWEDGRKVEPGILIVATIRWIGHNGDVWIHTYDKNFGTGNLVIHAEHMELVRRAS